jgi:hypothetical protein
MLICTKSNYEKDISTVDINNKNIETIKDFVGKGLFYIEIYCGANTFRNIKIDKDILIVPLGSIGNKQNIGYGSIILNKLGIETDKNFTDFAINEGLLFNSSSAIVYRNMSKNDIKKCIKEEFTKAKKIKTLLSIYTGGSLHKIINIMKNQDGGTSAKFLAPTTKRGLQSRTKDEPFGDDFIKYFTQEHLNNDGIIYRLSLLDQANSTPDESFRIASYFSILETLASPITSQFKEQTGDNKKRAAIRYMLGYFIKQHTPKFTINNSQEFEFDHIELAGKVRDKIFHGGGGLKEKDVNINLKSGVLLLQSRPDMICHVLRRDCEIAIYTYAKKESLAFKAKNGFKVKYLPPNTNYDKNKLRRLFVNSESEKGGTIGSVFVKTDGLDSDTLKIRVSGI